MCVSLCRSWITMSNHIADKSVITTISAFKPSAKASQKCPAFLSSEDVRVAAGPLEGDRLLLLRELVDEQPIRLDMTFTTVLEISHKGMVSVMRVQSILVDEKL